jgi:hypothetical protein
MKENNRQPSEQQERTGITDAIMDGARIISYNFSEDQRPGGMKVRAKIRIVTGRHAGTLNTRQAEAIRELLLWARQHRQARQG